MMHDRLDRINWNISQNLAGHPHGGRGNFKADHDWMAGVLTKIRAWAIANEHKPFAGEPTEEERYENSVTQGNADDTYTDGQTKAREEAADEIKEMLR